MKNVLFGFFWARIWKTIVISETSTFSRKDKKYLIFEQKKTCLGILELEPLKNYCHIWNQQPWICLFPKFCKKPQKCLNFKPKLPYFGNFGLIV